MRHNSDHLLSRKHLIINFIKNILKKSNISYVNNLFDANIEWYIHLDLIECIFDENDNIVALGLVRPVINSLDVFDTTKIDNMGNLICIDFLYLKSQMYVDKLLNALLNRFEQVNKIVYIRKLKKNFSPKEMSLERALKLITLFGEQ